MAEAAIALHDVLVPLGHHYETIPDLRHQSPPIKIIISMALIDLYQYKFSNIVAKFNKRRVQKGLIES